MDLKQELRNIIGESNDILLSSLLLRSKNIILAETNRTIVPECLQGIQLEIALELFNKHGSEGETSRSEGGISVTYSNELSPHIKKALSNHRLARSGGNVFENK